MWELFYHPESDCYWWVENPTEDDYVGDGHVEAVLGTPGSEDHLFRSRDEYGVAWPPGWRDPLI